MAACISGSVPTTALTSQHASGQNAPTPQQPPQPVNNDLAQDAFAHIAGQIRRPVSERESLPPPRTSGA